MKRERNIAKHLSFCPPINFLASKTGFALLLAVLLTGVAHTQKLTGKIPTVTFSGLKKSLADTVLVRAYVMDIYVCPPCPEGMQCKPCMENNFTIVEEKPVDVFKIPLEKRLRIFMPHPDSLKMNRRYWFTIRFRNKKTNPVDNAELVSYKER